MASPVIVTLAKNTKAAADALQYGLPGWTVTDTETNGALSAIVAANASGQHYALGVIVSFSAVPAAACTLTVKDGSTVIATVQFGVAVAGPVAIAFPRPLPGTINTAMEFALSSPGNITATVCGIGMSSPDQTTYA